MEFIRETFLGTLLRAFGFRGLIRYPEEVPGFRPQIDTPFDFDPSSSKKDAYHHAQLPWSSHRRRGYAPINVQVNGMKTQVIMVDWYDARDMANPRNWSSGKKAWVSSLLK